MEKESSSNFKVIFEEISQNEKHSVEELKNCFSLLQKLFKNLTDKPDEIKFRQFNKKNNHLSSKVLNIEKSLEFLQSLGYKESQSSPDILEINKDNINNISSIAPEIEKLIKELDEKIKLLPPKKEVVVETKNDYLKETENKIELGVPVTLLVYDLSNGMARQYAPMLLGKSLEGVWHTSILVYNKEYFYGGGINVSKPRQTPFGRPYKEMSLGYSEVPEDLLHDYINELRNEFKMENYNLISHNCNHFSSALAELLVGKPIPNDILKQHEILLGTPLGKMLMPMLEQVNHSPG